MTDETDPPKHKTLTPRSSVLLVKFDEGIECSHFVNVRCASIVV